MKPIPLELRKKSRKQVAEIYAEVEGSKAALAKRLGVARTTLYKWLREDPDLARALHRADAELFEARLKRARRAG